MLAEHHLALREYHPGWTGIVNTRLSPASLVRKVAEQVQELCEINYGSAPEVELTGHIDTVFAYIPVRTGHVNKRYERGHNRFFASGGHLCLTGSAILYLGALRIHIDGIAKKRISSNSGV